MKSYQKLSETDLAVHYMQAIGGAERMPDNACGLVADVEAWLHQSNFDHRLCDATTIAREAFEIARQVRVQAPTPTETEAAFRANIESGTTADDAALRQMNELALAGQVQQMSLAEFGANRERLGLSRSTFAHLAGE